MYDPPAGSTYTVRQHYDPLEKIEEDIIKFSKCGNVLLMGDFNARTSNSPDALNGDSDIVIPLYNDDTIPNRKSLDKTLDTRGKHLLELCIQSQLRILNGRCLGDTLGNFTCHNYNGSSVVDYSVISEDLYKDVVYFKVEKFKGTLSDHSMITTMVKIQNPIKFVPNNINLTKISRNYIKWSDEIKNQYITNMNSESTQEKISKLTTECNIHNNDRIVNTLSDILVSQLPKRKPHRKKANMKIKRKLNKWYNSNLYQLKTLVTKRGQLMSENPFDKTIRLSYFCLKKKYKKACKAKARAYKAELIKRLETLQYENPRQYWKILNDLLDSTKDKIDPSSTISPGEWYDYIFNLKTQTKHSTIENELNIRLKEMEKEKIFNELDFAITFKELTDAIAKLKNNKTPGLDNINNEMLKNTSQTAKTLILKIFNNILISGAYPQKWNKGYISTIYKSKSIQDPNNYRCLTINSSFGKLFNSILNERLTSYLIKHNIISPSQIGFQKDKRTSDHIYTLQTVIKKYTKIYKKKIYACFIDFKKAFDTIWHLGLLYKLKTINVGNNFYNIIKCMYTNNEVCVKFHDEITDFFTSTVGVKQGDNLSSTLFNIYINDLPTCLKNNCDPVKIGNMDISCLMYADDLILLSETPLGLQNQLNILNEYCNTWKLQINTEKSKVIIFESRKNNKNNATFYINSQSLEQVYTYKYLGVIINYRGEFNEGKQDLQLRAQKAYFKLRKLLNIDIINPKLYLDIFDKTVVPIATYASEVWGSFNTDTRRYMQNKSPEYLYDEHICEKPHLKLCKILLGVNQKASNHASRSELGRYPIMITIIANILCYRARLEKDKSTSILKETFNDDTMIASKDKTNWYSCTEEILRYLNLDRTFLCRYSSKTIRKRVIHKLKQSYDSYFRSSIFNDHRKDANENNKLRTFRLFKQNIKYEPYLDLHISKNIMKQYTQLRLSAHKLNIEIARYIKCPKELRTEQKLAARKCTNCDLNVDENEIHFLLECNKYDNIRTPFLNEIHDICMNTRHLNKEQTFIWLMSNEDKSVMIKSIKFVNECFKLRGDPSTHTAMP